MSVLTGGGQGWQVDGAVPNGVVLGSTSGSHNTNTDFTIRMTRNLNLLNQRTGTINFITTGMNPARASVTVRQDAGRCNGNANTAVCFVGSNGHQMENGAPQTIQGNSRDSHEFRIFNNANRALDSGANLFLNTSHNNTDNRCSSFLVINGRRVSSTVNDTGDTLRCVVSVQGHTLTNVTVNIAPFVAAQNIQIRPRPGTGISGNDITQPSTGGTLTIPMQFRFGDTGTWTDVEPDSISVTNIVRSGTNVSATATASGRNIIFSSSNIRSEGTHTSRITVRYVNPNIPGGHETAQTTLVVTQIGTNANSVTMNPQVCHFNSTGGSQSFDLFAGHSSSPEPSPVAPTAGSIRITSDDGNWLNVHPGGNGISVSAGNNTRAPRTAVVELNVPNGSHTFSCTQDGDPLIDIGPGSPDGGAPELVVECDLGPLGWALCPIIRGLDQMLGNIYGWVESEFLRVDLSFYDTNTPTHQAWSIFRNIANVLFVIFFLVVIFSQVTSIGISNYGIKKMLPEIIMAAILINLSYFIVQAMIDLSNVVGHQIHRLLSDISGVVSDGTINVSIGTNSGLLTTFLNILSITAVTGLIISVVSGGFGALFVAAIVFLISAAVAILMLFVLLVVRQVGIIILLVLSPLAFAARILPGTAGLFRKWWSMLVALLVVYPACGLVIGAGLLAGSIIAGRVDGSPTPELFAVVAMIAVIAPYFAVISIIKGSLGGLGKLGAMVTGAALGAGATAKLMGAKGVNAAGKQVGNLTGYTASRDAKLNAKTALAKEKAEAKSAELAADGRGVFGRLQNAQIETSQYKDNASLASVGQYVSDGSNSKEDRRLTEISNRKQAEIGVDAEGNPTRPAQNATERELQRRALTARQQQERRVSDQFDKDNEVRDFSDVRNEVMERDAAGNLTGNLRVDASTAQGRMQVEQAVKKMRDVGEWGEAANISDALMQSGHMDRSSQRRLGDILTKGETKEKALPLHALGSQLQTNAARNVAAPESIEAFMTATDEHGNNIVANSIRNSDRYDNSIAGLHRESATILSEHDTTGAIRQAIGDKTSGKVFAQMGDQAALNLIGQDGNGTQIFARAIGDINTMDGSTRASMGYSQTKQAIAGTDGARRPAPPRIDPETGRPMSDGGIIL
jgi:hypothetical protein